jgi:hypothetical protein
MQSCIPVLVVSKTSLVLIPSFKAAKAKAKHRDSNLVALVSCQGVNQFYSARIRSD